MTPFLKMHGLGNDFVVFDARNRPVLLQSKRARAIADRRLGVGCDQVIVIENADGVDARMRIYNADGGEVESCGNAARCVAQLLFEESCRDAIRLDTDGGLLVCRAAGDQVTADMGAPRFGWRDIPLAEARDTNAFQLDVSGFDLRALKEVSAVSVGNPHCVLFVENAEEAPVAPLGRAIENHPLFPERTNVEFVQVLAPDRLRMRVWERGAGITRACGTGACAAVAAAQRRGLCATKVEVLLDGGPLTIEWQGGDAHIFMTGPTALSFRGEIDLDSLA
jgi:diaminopimelate epimerase